MKLYKENAIRAVVHTFTTPFVASHDSYTPDVLRNQYKIFKQYAFTREQASAHTNIRIRMPCIPEDISENMIKFILQNYQEDDTHWKCGSGDLLSWKEGKQECKCFTSDGPSSFTPFSTWDVIYFMDARQWRRDQFILYRVSLSNQSDIWKNIKVNKTQTFQDQVAHGRRPRIPWKYLFPQISKYCEIIFQGEFEDMFSKVERSRSEICRTIGTDTAFPANEYNFASLSPSS